jgi:hypothetical protein
MPQQFQRLKSFICILILPFFFSSFRPSIRGKKQLLPNEGFALVELFTSEGCSSCPPADEAVGRLNGWKKNIYILSFHVDYWNYLGWKDVFSNPAYSSRQQEYGSMFHLSSIYTPQIIVNGKVEFVGSDEIRLRETIEESIKEIPEGEIRLKVQKENNNQIPVTCISGNNLDLKLNLALVQDMSTNFIQRGENKGKTLSHFFIVRDFQVFRNPKDSGIYYLKIPPGLSSHNCSVISFLQNPENGHIIAASGASIP